jgi:hypothetical protein
LDARINIAKPWKGTFCLVFHDGIVESWSGIVDHPRRTISNSTAEIRPRDDTIMAQVASMAMIVISVVRLIIIVAKLVGEREPVGILSMVGNDGET